MQFGDAIQGRARSRLIPFLGEIVRDRRFEPSEQLGQHLVPGSPGFILRTEMTDRRAPIFKQLLIESTPLVTRLQCLDSSVPVATTQQPASQVARSGPADFFDPLDSFGIEGQLSKNAENLVPVLLRFCHLEDLISSPHLEFHIVDAFDHFLKSHPRLFYFPHILVGTRDEIACRFRFLRVRPVIDHGLETLSDRSVHLAEPEQAMTPHELGIGRRTAALVEGEELLILIECDLVFPLEIMLFGDLELITFDLSHLAKRLDRDLLERRKTIRRVDPKRRKQDSCTNQAPPFSIDPLPSETIRSHLPFDSDSGCPATDCIPRENRK